MLLLHKSEPGCDQLGSLLHPIILIYLYTVGILSPHTLASSLTFIFPAISAGYTSFQPITQRSISSSLTTIHTDIVTPVYHSSVKEKNYSIRNQI